jgi:hypothetical protein
MYVLNVNVLGCVTSASLFIYFYGIIMLLEAFNLLIACEHDICGVEEQLGCSKLDSLLKL